MALSLLILGILLTMITIILVGTKQSRAATIVSAFFALLAYFVSLYPFLFNQSPIEPIIVLSVKELNLISTDEYDLKTIIYPDDSDIRWNSDNTNIVTVDNNGHLKAIDEGDAIITATVVYKDIEYTDICNVTVNNPAINLESACVLSVGEVNNLSAITIPENVDIGWSSSNPNIVSVSNNGKIEGLLEGRAVITATMTYNNKRYSVNCDIVVEENAGKNDAMESEKEESIDSVIIPNEDSQESESGVVSIRDAAWLDDEKIYKDDYAITMRGEEWADCIRFGSNNINADGTSVLRVACDRKYSRFTAEIAPQEGFDKTETVTFYIYGVTDDVQIFVKEFQIDYSTKPFKVEYDLSDIDELYFWKSGNYNQGRIAGQFINGYTGMSVLMRDAILYE